MVVPRLLATSHDAFPLGVRGQRPLRFPIDRATGTALADVVPGATWAKGYLSFTWDALMVMQRAFPFDAEGVHPKTDALKFPGYDRYLKFFSEKLRGYQKEMVKFLVTRSYAINADPMRCVSANTVVTVRWMDSKRVERITIRELARLYHYSPRPFEVRSVLRPDDASEQAVEQVPATTFWNRCTLIHSTGLKRVFRVSLHNGTMLFATKDHRVWRATSRPDAQGVVRRVTIGKKSELRTATWVPVEELRPGDCVLLSHGLHLTWSRIKNVNVDDIDETFDLTMENPHNHYLANGILVANSGKTPTTLAAATLIDAQRTLIVCPSIAKLVWATEIAKWLGESALLLYGRGGNEAREFCVNCMGSGMRDGKQCPDCRTRNKQSFGTRIHSTPDACAAAIAKSRWVIVNYDILIPQAKLNAAGMRSLREDLPGWVKVLLTWNPDLVIPDEGHTLRGRPKRERKGENKRDRLKEVASLCDRMWVLTGTPIFGHVADLYSLVDVLTNGLFGSPWSFDRVYAGGHKGEFGWVNSGMTNPDQLKSRLDTFMLKRHRSEILPELPRKVRQVIRLDGSKANFVLPKEERTASGLHNALRITAKIKQEAVVESVVDECGENAKVVVFTYQRTSAESLAQAIAVASQKDPRLKLRNFRAWCVTGDTPSEARFKQAQAYREWPGAAVFVATIDSVPVAISLNGATSVHFADMTFDPASLLQAEDRPYEVGTTGLTILYYVVDRTVDDHVVSLVLPKMEQMERMTGEQAANDFRAAFGAIPDMDKLADDIWQRMTQAALKTSAEE